MNKIIVITGSSRGIGYNLVKAFIERSCSVVVSGSTQASTEQAVEKLQTQSNNDPILGVPCDIQDYEQVQNLWDATIARHGRVDIWINNAGLSGPTAKIWVQEPSKIRQVISTNLIGTIFGSRVAVNGMSKQGYGAIYNMEGMGSDGRRHDGLALYGTSKYGLHYFNRCLHDETRGLNLIVGALRPGMVITDLITAPYADHPEDFEKVKRIFNIIADRPERVAPWLAEKILTNQKSGVTISYSSTLKLLWRFLSAPIARRDVFSQ
jgi:NAD(P)-dependent dehydrogenase (short-subunit alcohol dehydrogenase family)